MNINFNKLYLIDKLVKILDKFIFFKNMNKEVIDLILNYLEKSKYNNKDKKYIRKFLNNLSMSLVETKFESKTNSKFESIKRIIAENTDKNIILLRSENILKWLLDDTSFLSQEFKNKKEAEDNFGWNTYMQFIKPKKPISKKQWTTLTGQKIAEELLILSGSKCVQKPVKKGGFQPDLSTEDFIIEVKTQTYFTSGTAGEKILGTPLKYADIPSLYNKKLKILCLAGAEKEMRTKYNLFGDKNTESNRNKFIDFFKANNIEYISASKILYSLIDNSNIDNSNIDDLTINFSGLKMN
jgi:hypothetical protein